MRLLSMFVIVVLFSMASVSAQNIITADCANGNSAEWVDGKLTIRYDNSSRSYDSVYAVVELHWRPDCAMLLIRGDKWVEIYPMSDLDNPWMLYDISGTQTGIVDLDYGYISETDTAFIAIAVAGEDNYIQVEYWQGYSLPNTQIFKWKRTWGISATAIDTDEDGRGLTVIVPPAGDEGIRLDVSIMFHHGEAPAGW